MRRVTHPPPPPLPVAVVKGAPYPGVWSCAAGTAYSIPPVAVVRGAPVPTRGVFWRCCEWDPVFYATLADMDVAGGSVPFTRLRQWLLHNIRRRILRKPQCACSIVMYRLLAVCLFEQRADWVDDRLICNVVAVRTVGWCVHRIGCGGGYLSWMREARAPDALQAPEHLVGLSLAAAHNQQRHGYDAQHDPHHKHDDGRQGAA